MSFHPLRRLCHLVFSLLTGFVVYLWHQTPRLSTKIGRALAIGEYPLHFEEESGRKRDHAKVTLDTLPDDVLVEIFDFYVNDRNARTNEWYTLVRVCQRWRRVVLASPHRLNLRLLYTGKRPLSDMLDTWPLLPVVVRPRLGESLVPGPNWNNIAALIGSEHRDRICEIDLYCIPDSRPWKTFTAVMQKPFPKLTRLRISVDIRVFALPTYPFLSGCSAPCLRELSLGNCPFPAMDRLLWSANDLVVLDLWRIPLSGYISPEALVTALSVMTRLETLRLEFQSPRSRPNPASRSAPPLTRSVLPALANCIFRGAHEYLEDLVARIETPLLNHLDIDFSVDIHFDVPQLRRLVSHAERFKTFDRAVVSISDDAIQVTILPQTEAVNRRRGLVLGIMCGQSDRQLSSLAQICRSSLPLVSTLEQLDIQEGTLLSQAHWKGVIQSSEWLELLGPFIAVKDLYLSDGVTRHVCRALQELARERATEMLPALRNLFLECLSQAWEPLVNAIGPFVSARRHSGHPVAIHNWKRWKR
ncbi:hypothetical protein F5148DRAFT_103993 [Russula earlei]|uniref:Uncharacterized protein n=1 Tax=Russula earlei TaxID=71964 RepID=A0ACC0U7D7_9AGAM|nr:hypothetical protein F5148DRAFT_103993 [Russula earlei]